jgi:LacI family transcriptional regulator
MATEKDIAKRAGLGLATVSKYLNGGNVREKNRLALEQAVRELGYTRNEHARALKTKRSKTIGFVIPELSNAFITRIITVMEDRLRASGYGSIICDCRTDGDREKDSVRFLLGKMADGIISMPVSADGSHLEEVLSRHLPVVLIDRYIPFPNEVFESHPIGAVLVNNSEASKLAVDALIAVGHTKIGIVLGPKDVFTSQQRLLGYNQAHIENFMMPSGDLAIFSDYTTQGGYESMKQLLEKGVTAAFATNYEMTLGAIIALNEAGAAIPGDISFIGFDNLQLSRVVKPKLTMVDQPLEQIGESAADLIIGLVEGNPPKSRIVTLNAQMIPGESVGSIS